MTIDDYLDLAKSAGGFASDRALAAGLGLSPNACSQFRTKRAWPSDDTMFRLAQLAGVTPHLALLDLCRWRSEGPAHAAYDRIEEVLRRVNDLGTKGHADLKDCILCEIPNRRGRPASYEKMPAYHILPHIRITGYSVPYEAQA